MIFHSRSSTLSLFRTWNSLTNKLRWASSTTSTPPWPMNPARAIVHLSRRCPAPCLPHWLAIHELINSLEHPHSSKLRERVFRTNSFKDDSRTVALVPTVSISHWSHCVSYLTTLSRLKVFRNNKNFPSGRTRRCWDRRSSRSRACDQRGHHRPCNVSDKKESLDKHSYSSPCSHFSSDLYLCLIDETAKAKRKK